MPVRPNPPRTPNNSPVNPGIPQPSATTPLPACLARVNAALAAHTQTTTQPITTTTATGTSNTRTRAGAATTTPHTRLIETILASPKLDIYANRPQHQMIYYCATHMLFFSVIVYFRITRHDMLVEWEKRALFPPTVVFAWFDELLPFCIFTFYALIYFRIPATVSKWEYIAMVVSWIKSILTLQEIYHIRADPERRAARLGIGFPGHDFQSYLIFVLVRFLVFGGLYKMVQAGLRERWAWKYRRPTPYRRTVVRAHRSLPKRFQRLRAGGGGGGWFGWTAGRKEEEVDEMTTRRGRRRWWGVYRTKRWIVTSRMLLEMEAAEIEAERKAAEEASTDTEQQAAGEEVELQVLKADGPGPELEETEAKADAEAGPDKELEGLEAVEAVGAVESVETITEARDISLDSKEGRQAFWDKKGRENW